MAEHIEIENAKIMPDEELRIILKMLRENDNVRAVMALDLFTKLYCKDNTVVDDLVFRCSECEFEAQDKRCLVKVMAHKLAPNYREFGSMGDL